MNATTNQYEDRHLLRLFRASGTRVSVSSGEIIQSTQDTKQCIFYVNSGFIKRYLIKSDGNESVQGVYGAGEVFPLTVVMRELCGKELYEGREDFFYETLSEAEIIKLDVCMLLQAAEKEPLIYQDLLCASASRLHSNIQRLENISLATSCHRVAHQLLYYARKYGESTPEGTKITLSLTHNDLSYILNLARETVSREISHFKSDGVILSGEQHHFVIPDLEKLEDIAYG